MTVNDIYVRKTHVLQTIEANETIDSAIYDIGAMAYSGGFSLQLYVTGTGVSVDAQCLQSNDKTNFVIANGVANICSNYPGVADEDHKIFGFIPVSARFMKIRLTETQGAAGSVEANLSIG